MKCDPLHKEGYSKNTEVAKAGIGIVSYFTVYAIVGCLVALLLF